MIQTKTTFLRAGFILCILLTIGFAGCVHQQQEAMPESPFTDTILRIGVTDGPKQLVGTDGKGNYTGLEIELLNILAKQSGCLPEFTKYSKEELIFALRRGEIDIAVPCATDAEIRDQFLLPCAPHLKTGQRIIAGASVAMYIKSPEQLNSADITVLTVADSVSANLAKSVFPAAEKISLRTAKMCLDRLKHKTGNVFMLDACRAYMVKKHFDNRKEEQAIKVILPPLTDEHICWALRRSDTARCTWLNNFINELRGKSILQDLIEKYNADIINR